MSNASNHYREFSLNLFDCLLNIKLSESFAYVPAAEHFQKFFARETPPDMCAAGLTCTVLDLVKPFISPEADLSAHNKALAYYPVLQHDLTRQVMAGREMNEYILVQPTRLAIFDPAKLEITAFVSERSEEKNAQSVQAFIFMLAAFVLAERGGLLIHAYGLVVDGLSCAIVGPSDAGKSTAGSLIQKDCILSDDVIGITGVGSRPYAHASPLATSGITDGPCKAPLAAVFFPVKAARFDLQPISPRDAFLRYLDEHADYIGRLIKPIKTRYFDHAHALFHQVPAYELHFTKDYIDSGRIREVMGRGKKGIG